MTCPVCEADTKVNGVKTAADCVLRSRKCKVCGYSFKTIEIDVDMYEKIKGEPIHADHML